MAIGIDWSRFAIVDGKLYHCRSQFDMLFSSRTERVIVLLRMTPCFVRWLICLSLASQSTYSTTSAVTRTRSSMCPLRSQSHNSSRHQRSYANRTTVSFYQLTCLFTGPFYCHTFVFLFESTTSVTLNSLWSVLSTIHSTLCTRPIA